MKYPALKELKDKEIRRLTGVKRSTFVKMVGILKEAEIKKKALGGKPNSLEMEDSVSANIKCTRHLHEKCTKKKDTKLKV